MRKLILVLCIAFVVVCYGYPCFILPFGNYTYTTTVSDEEITYTYKFGFDGKVSYSTSLVDNVSIDYYYKLKGNTILLSLDEDFDDSTNIEIKISNMYTLGSYTNQIGMWISVAVGVVALVAVLNVPKRKN